MGPRTSTRAPPTLSSLSAQPALQRSTLTLYGELLCRRSDWGGDLVFSAFPGAAQTGLSAAASLAGSASLIVDADLAAVHASNRDGAFDFVVNSLDEALRALKNELRLRRPLAVALTADPHKVTEEAARRGLAPTLILSTPGLPVPTGLLEASPIFLEPPRDGAETELLQAWLRDRQWSAHLSPRLQPATRDQQSPAQVTPPQDRIRHPWLHNLTRHQRSARQGDRWLWMTPEEIQEQQRTRPNPAPDPPL